MKDEIAATEAAPKARKARTAPTKATAEQFEQAGKRATRTVKKTVKAIDELGAAAAGAAKSAEGFSEAVGAASAKAPRRPRKAAPKAEAAPPVVEQGSAEPEYTLASLRAALTQATGSDKLVRRAPSSGIVGRLSVKGLRRPGLSAKNIKCMNVMSSIIQMRSTM